MHLGPVMLLHQVDLLAAQKPLLPSVAGLINPQGSILGQAYTTVLLLKLATAQKFSCVVSDRRTINSNHKHSISHCSLLCSGHRAVASFSKRIAEVTPRSVKPYLP